MDEEKVCIYCGRSFVQKHGTVGKYCSQQCWIDYRRENNVQMKPRTLPDIVCSTCGKVFRPRGHQQAYDDKHYCSRRCQYEGMKSKQSTRCPVCGKLFTVTCDRKQYCSRECAHVALHAAIRKYATKAEGRRAWNERYKEAHREEREAAAKAKEVEREKKKAEREALRLAEAERKRLSKLHPCATCGKITDRPKYCSDRCNKTAYNNRKDARRCAKIRDALVDKDITLADVYRNDMGLCYLCGKPCSWEDYREENGTIICGPHYPSIEHVIPLSKGGKHSWQNVRLACRKCNWEKSDHIPPASNNLRVGG